jgi:hypothetical protein
MDLPSHRSNGSNNPVAPTNFSIESYEKRKNPFSNKARMENSIKRVKFKREKSVASSSPETKFSQRWSSCEVDTQIKALVNGI